MDFIIDSLLDTDFYKFTMGQFVFRRYKDVPVTYAFKNRTKGVALAHFIKEEDLRRELDHVRTLRFTNTELHYLRGTNEYSERMFDENYLEFLRELLLPEYHLEWGKDNFILEFSGPWAETIYWETFPLSIINQLYYKSLIKSLTKRFSQFERDVVYARGVLRLAEKIKEIKKYPITFSDFGTRRRFNTDWQGYVVGVLSSELSKEQFIGTSNVALAMEYGCTPVGTSAHELFMVMSGIMHEDDEDIRASHNRVLKEWRNEFGYGLSIALTDTYGSDFFFRDMTEKQAKTWKGLRWDSGNPYAFGDKAIVFYKSHGIEPSNKMIVFSDGLDVGKMINIAKYFAGRIQVTFGWGTNLTNDLGLEALSLVVKPVEACGYGLVKLSDNIAKAIGKPQDIERFKRIFGYANDFYEECKY